MQGLCRVLCIVCRVFLFSLLFTYIVVIATETVNGPGGNSSRSIDKRKEGDEEGGEEKGKGQKMGFKIGKGKGGTIG